MRSLRDSNSSWVFPDAPLPAAAGDIPPVDGSLSVVDDLLAIYARQQEEDAAHTRGVLLERQRFLNASACMFDRVVGPAFREIAERLNVHGGGGLVQEHPAQGRHGQRLTLWMSPEGPVAVPPRIDRNPYIQLEVDVLWRHLEVWEGDMWHKRGASRCTESMTLEEVTTENVTARAVGVLRRTVNRGDPPGEVAQ